MIEEEVPSFSMVPPDNRPTYQGNVPRPSGLPAPPAPPVRNSTIQLNSNDGSMIVFMAQNGQMWRAARGAMDWAWARLEVPTAMALKAFPAIATIAANYSPAHAANLRWAATGASVVDTAYNVLQPVYRTYQDGGEDINWKHVAAGVAGGALSIGGALLSQLGDTSTLDKAKQMTSVATGLLFVGGQLSYEYRPTQEPFVPMVASPMVMSVIDEGNTTRAASRRSTALQLQEVPPLFSGRPSRTTTALSAATTAADAAALRSPGTSAVPLAGRNVSRTGTSTEAMATQTLSRRSSAVRLAAR
ncbi:hypothetical protein [Streptomyces globisporus]|uniref:hypothetical protein n=1 Tax=Streptomyces globisporus TaxID=1908 RepID=UPI00380D21F2